MVERDRHIQRIIQLGKQANIAMFTVGTVHEDALLFRLGYLSKEEQKAVQRIGAGDICSRFLMRRARCAARISTTVRWASIWKICATRRNPFSWQAGRKVDAIRAALIGKYANILVTDQFTAQALLS